MTVTSAESNNYYLDIAAHEVRFLNVELPIDLGRGATLKYSSIEETDAIDNYFGFGNRAGKVADKYICFEISPEYQNEREWPFRTRHAFALLPREIIFRSVVLRMQRHEGKLGVGGTVVRYRECGSAILESGNFLLTKVEEFNQSSLQRVRALVDYPLESDPYVSSFESAHNSFPSSEFRFVSYMSIVEGLVTPTNSIRHIRDNIASKMEYFYTYIWPTLSLSSGLEKPHFRDGRVIEDVRGVWADLYKIRNSVVHGARESLGQGGGLGDGFGTLHNVSLAESSELLDYGLKSLLYWQLERQEERQSFAQIV